jgi:hemolysin III
MTKACDTRELPQSPGEEMANSVSHGVGLALAIVAAPALVWATAHRGDAANVVGAAVFAVSMVLLYLSSTLCHSLAYTRAGRTFQILDHGAIYLLIAGTYTPFTLGVLRGAWGWTLLAIVWGLALSGVVFKACCGVRHPRISIALYLAMGWLVVIAIKPLLLRMPPRGLLWLVAGGIAYTAGVVFYSADSRIRYGHLVWHLFVIAGTACHFVAVLRYAA